MPALDLVQAREPVHVRHPDVEQHELGLRPAHEREDLRPGLRLADDLEVAVRLERAPDAVEDEPVVVGDQDAHRGSVAQDADAVATARPGRRLRAPLPRRGPREAPKG